MAKHITPVQLERDPGPEYQGYCGCLLRCSHVYNLGVESRTGYQRRTPTLKNDHIRWNYSGSRRPEQALYVGAVNPFIRLHW